MKKIFALCCMMLMLSLVEATYAGDGDCKSKDNVGNNQWTIGLRADLYNFYAPVWKDFGGKDSVDNYNWHYGPTLSVWKNFSSSISFGAEIGFADIKVGKNDEALLPAHNKHVFLFGGGLVYKFNNGYIFKENAPVAPYIYGKVVGNIIKDGANNDEKALTANVPVGLGLNFKVANDFAIQVQAGYSFGITDIAEDNINAGIGFAWDIDRVKKAPEVLPMPEVIILDTDGDGVADDDDQCPEIRGIAAMNGCPDTDGDGITDSEDDCPLVAGLQNLNGCPDTDGDGISDAKDACPTEVGVARFGGCPDVDRDGDGVVNAKDKCPDVAGAIITYGCPDRDADGVSDAQDKCPDTAGPADNGGCPRLSEELRKKLTYDARHIEFETGKAVLKPSSFGVLDEAAKILNDYPYYNLNIDGYTDNVGSDELNQKLSGERADAAAKYLVGKGVSADRLVSKGHGESNPIATNNTPAGRQQNRRVEFSIFMKD